LLRSRPTRHHELTTPDGQIGKIGLLIVFAFDDALPLWPDLLLGELIGKPVETLLETSAE